jgi:hypothetical protein
MCPAAEAPPPGVDALDAAGCLDAFLEVQAQRAEAYRRFDAVFQAYLATAAEGPYSAGMAASTTEFQALSQRVLALEAALRGRLAQGGAADALRAVQAGEREKLQATLALHALKSAVAHRRFSWQHEGHEGHEGCACGGAPAGEASEGDLAGATRDAVRQLQACVTAINDAIDEVRQLREDLLPESGA